MGVVVMESPTERTPPRLHDGVKAGILESIKRDVEHRGGRTVRLLIAAGVLGVIGGAGITFLVSTHPTGHHPPWHIALFSSVWAGLLIVSLTISFLRLRTSSLPLAKATGVGILGLGLAGICGAACPEQHFLYWWSSTSIGAPLSKTAGPALSAMCFGVVATVFFGAVSAFILISRSREFSVRPILPAAMLFVLLAPGVALQSINTSWLIFGGWILGTGLGAYLGVSLGIRARSLLSSESA